MTASATSRCAAPTTLSLEPRADGVCNAIDTYPDRPDPDSGGRRRRRHRRPVRLLHRSHDPRRLPPGRSSRDRFARCVPGRRLPERRQQRRPARHRRRPDRRRLPIRRTRQLEIRAGARHRSAGWRARADVGVRVGGSSYAAAWRCSRHGTQVSVAGRAGRSRVRDASAASVRARSTRLWDAPSVRGDPLSRQRRAAQTSWST